MFMATRIRIGALFVLSPLLAACNGDAAPLPSADPPTQSPVASVIEPSAGVVSSPSPDESPTLGEKKSPVPDEELSYTFPLESVAVADYGPGHHDYRATDIFAPVGTRVVAVTSGIVDFVSRKDSYDPDVDDPSLRGGLSVAFIGDDGVRYYGSHLLTVAPGIAPGVRVETGDLLGEVGQSGNAATTAPHLHFGISHPTSPNDWEVRRGEIDPYEYLLAWERGEDITPRLED